MKIKTNGEYKFVKNAFEKLSALMSLAVWDVHVCVNFSRKDLPLKQCKTDILLITGVLSSYANVVEKLHRDLEKTKATLLKIERAGDVLLQAVSSKIN
jgi:hypothetical protein